MRRAWWPKAASTSSSKATGAGHRLRHGRGSLGRIRRVCPRAAGLDRAAAGRAVAAREHDPRHGRLHGRPVRSTRCRSTTSSPSEPKSSSPGPAAAWAAWPSRSWPSSATTWWPSPASPRPMSFSTTLGARGFSAAKRSTTAAAEPLLPGRWAGGGGHGRRQHPGTSSARPARRLRGGLRPDGGHDLPMTVYPFILRGVTPGRDRRGLVPAGAAARDLATAGRPVEAAALGEIGRFIELAESAALRRRNPRRPNHGPGGGEDRRRGIAVNVGRTCQVVPGTRWPVDNRPLLPCTRSSSTPPTWAFASAPTTWTSCSPRPPGDCSR